MTGNVTLPKNIGTDMGRGVAKSLSPMMEILRLLRSITRTCTVTQACVP